MADRHGKKELGIFERFARAAGLRVEPGTVEKRPPPEPDILCSVVGGARIAFELVEIIDRDFAERVYGQLRLKSLFERDAESRAQNAPIRSALANALVYVTFQEASFDSKRAAIPYVLAFLGGLSPLFQGELRPASLASMVRSIRVARVNASGPFFDVDAAGSLGDPTVERIRAKCAKRYETPHPIELLAYYELQPECPEQLWRSGLESVLDQSWDSCGFQRVWLYDCGAEAIRFTRRRPS